MQRLWSWLRSPLFMVVLLSLGAVRPILTSSQTPLADDFAYHLQRLIALRHLVSEGIIFTRWFPDLALGYGYPLFNFAAPLPYYVALPFSWLFSAETAIQITLALAVILSGWGMLQLLRCFVKPSAALIGATAWLYSPYVLYDVHFRANLGEVFALAALPFAFWGITKLARTPQRRWLLLTSLSITTTLLSHNVIGLLLLPLVGVYALALASPRLNLGATNVSPHQMGVSYMRLQNPIDGVIDCSPESLSQGDRLFTVFRSLFTAILLGLGIATFFWLPAFIEKEAAAFPRLMSNPVYSVFNNFLTLGELFALPSIVYANRINPSPPITLGIIPVVIASLGWLGWRKMTREKRVLFALLTVATMLITFMVTGYSEWVWQQIALLQFFQFPWRLLAFGALFVAVMAGFSAEILPKPLQIITLLLILLNAQSWTLPAYAPKGEMTLTEIIAYEQAVGTLGTTVAGEYLPDTVDVVPESPPEQLFVGEGIVEERQERSFRPKFTTTITHPTPQTVTLNQFAFAGWQATVNGDPVSISPNEPNGLITLPISAGTNEITVQFASTPLRTFASFASFASFAFLFLIASRQKSIKRDQVQPLLAPKWIAPVAIVALLLPFLRPAQSAENTLADYGDVRLISAEFPTSITADELISVHLTFAIDVQPSQILQSKLTLHDANGVLYSLPDSRVAPRFRSAIPSNAWPPNHTVSDLQLIEPISGIPTGDYNIELTLFNRQTLLPLHNQTTNRTTHALGTVTVEQIDEPSLSPPNPVQSMQPSPKLIGYEVDRAEVRLGDPILLSLFWQTESDITFTPDFMFVEFGDRQETADLSSPHLTYTMNAGSSIQTRHLLVAPPDLTREDAEIIVVVNGEAQTAIPLRVVIPSRTFTPPSVELLVEESVADGVMFYGVSVKEREGEISAELIWHTLNKLDTRYRVYVHLIDANDNIIAQSDADPANWTRPTTSWLPNEYISDVHTLPTPDHAYRLRIGLYDPIDLSRLAEPILLDLSD